LPPATRYSTILKKCGAIKYYDESDGLANNQALCILKMTTFIMDKHSNGLSKFDPEKEQFRNFTARMD